MEEQDRIKKFIEKLEELIIQKEKKLEEYRNQKKEYKYIQGLLEVSEYSKIALAEGIITLREDKKGEFYAVLDRIIPDQETKGMILQAMLNLYQLNEIGLLEQQEVADQKEEAERAIDYFTAAIKDYASKMDLEDISHKQKALKSYIEKIIALGTQLNQEPLEEEISDIEILEKALEEIEFDEEEKIAFLQWVLRSNVRVYERTSEKTEEEERELQEDVPKKDLEQLEEILQDKKLTERILIIINDAYDSSISSMREEVRVESLSLAVEEILKDMKEHKKTAKEAVEDFIKRNDNSKEKLKTILGDIEEVDYTEEEENKILIEARNFWTTQKNKLQAMSQEDKERLDNYLISYYQQKENRITSYERKWKNNPGSVQLEAAYEIQKLLNYLHYLKKSERQTIHKILRRIEEVLTSLKMVEQKDTEILEEEIEEPKTRNIYFLKTEEDSEISYLEEDIQKMPQPTKKPIYKETVKLLKKLASPKTEISISEKNHLIQKITGQTMNVYYIATEEDILIIGGESIEEETDSMSSRIPSAKDQIHEMKKKEIKSWFLKKSKEVLKRLSKEARKNQTKTPVEEMLEEDFQTTDDTGKTKK